MSEVRIELESWEALQRNPCFKELVDIAQQQIQVRHVEVLSPMHSPDLALGRELVKGEALGIGMFIAVAEARTAELRETLEQENEDGSD